MLAEWTKLRTVPSTPWLLAGTVAVTIAVTALYVSSLEMMECLDPAGCVVDFPKFSLWGIWGGQAVVAGSTPGPYDLDLT